jgi:hypothetical protein
MKCPLEARRAGAAVWADDIPGGVEIANAIMHDDGTPKRYYSKSEIRMACQVKGVTPFHDVWQEGGNKILADARTHDDWLRSSEAQKQRQERVEMRREGYLK